MSAVNLWTRIRAQILQYASEGRLERYLDEELEEWFRPVERPPPEGDPGSFPPWLIDSLHQMDSRLRRTDHRLGVLFDGGGLTLPISAHLHLAELEDLQLDLEYFVSFARIQISEVAQ